MKKTMNQSTLTMILNGGSIFALVVVIVLLFVYGSVSGQLDDANEDRFNLTYNANRFMNGSSYLTNEVRAFASTGEQEHYDNYWNEINNLKNRDQGVAAMQEIGITDQEQAMIDKMSSLSNELVPLEEEAMNQVQEGELQEALNYVYGTEYSTAIAEINSVKEQFLSDLDERTGNEVKNLGRRSDFIRLAMILALVMVGALQITNQTVTRKKILKPVIAVRDQMKEISCGNLSAEFALEPDTSEIGMLVQSIHETKQELKKYINDIDAKLAQMAQGNMDMVIGDDYRGEFQPIQKAMRQILEALNSALSQINQSAEHVTAESEQVADGAQILSRGAMDQASAVEELTANIQELSGQVDNSSADADHARKSSMDAARQLELCNTKMEELTRAMEDISKSSLEIGGIIKTIEDISFQTNILALNAAVEAARAGETGKGFAVVADEVQSLANKSSEAAQNITSLIEDSIKLVQEGTALSADTTEALAAGVLGARRSTELVERIAESAEQQVEALRQLTQGMEQISDVVQTNAATAEKSAASASELLEQAHDLKGSVQKFRLRQY
ncbi:methyl-accepting chemotaxis protein [Lachnospiraceae bacterium]|jgi:methyl-accepting chemotaxis protein|nr:methyl-accepting chemotaxis protein [uncultured Schaedlerella sp.]MCI9153643.1 methyl-accepting chemotaxis protein [Ruminococcus sp.]NBI56703.1 methyl-accepting chemotaxis protein [Lachnospiraceae bacterium]